MFCYILSKTRANSSQSTSWFPSK